MAVEAGRKAKKPIYAFVWQRFSESNEKESLQLLPEKQFSKHLDIILNTRYQNTRVTGLIWFDGIKYYYRTKPNLASMDARSMEMDDSDENKVNVEDSIIKKYAEIMIQRVSKRKL